MQKISLFFIVIFLFTSCSNYFKAVTAPVSASNIESLNKNKKYFILHSGKRAFTMTNISLSDENTIHCTLENIAEDHRAYLTKKKKLIYKAGSGEYDESAVLNEAHIYIADTTAAIGNYNMPISNVQKIEILEKDKQKTSRNHTRFILISAGAVTVAALIAAGASLLILLYFKLINHVSYFNLHFFMAIFYYHNT